MSDTNDKKPGPNLSDWQTPAATPQQGQAFGHVAEDPLAALERIVSEGQPAEREDNFLGQQGNNDDLRALEEELLKELRGEQPPLVQPTQPVQRAPTASAPREEPFLHAPMPTSDSAPATPQEPMIEDLPPLRFGSSAGFSEDPVAPAPTAAPEPVAPAAPAGPDLNFGLDRDGGFAGSSAPAPAAPTPTSAPSVDHWADFSAQPAAPEAPVVEEAPAAPQVSSYQSHEPKTGSYGQLTDPVAATPAAPEPVAPAPAVEPTLSWPQSTTPAPEPQIDLSDALAQAVSEQTQADSTVSQGYGSDRMSGSGLDAYERKEPSAGFGYAADPAPQQPVAPAVPEPVAPVVPPVTAAPAPVAPVPVAPAPSAPVDSYVPSSLTTEGQAVEDPYAAFNQPVASQPAVDPVSTSALGGAPLVDPMAAGYNTAPPPQADDGYYHTDPAAGAPSVNVTGQSEPAPYSDVYNTGYEPDATNQQAGYGESPLYGAGAAPMASGPHGTYADPAVSQAAAESMPYLADQDGMGYQQGMEAEAEEPKAGLSKSKKGLLAASVALGIAVVGGAAVWGLTGSSSNNGEAPVLVANTDPVKEAPEDPGGKVIPHQNKEVYDRIDGTQSDEGPGNLMPATEKPLAMTNDGKSPRVISLSGGETSVPQASGGGATSSQSQPSIAAPKKVRTVIVRPDGTIVKSSEAGNGTSNQLGSVDQQMMAATPSEQAMSQSLNSVPGGGVQGSDANAAGQAAGDGVTTSTLPKRKPNGLANQQASIAPTTQPVATAPAPAQPVAVTPPAPVAPATNQPLSLLPPAGGQPAPSQPAAPAPVASNNSGAGGYTVQVTSQRTPEQARASYSSIQSRLAGVLGGYQPDIKRADLGTKGVYYRVRVGSFADRSGATNFCQSIKAAGGDCLVARK